MRKMTSDEIRDTWLNFFKEKGHHIEPSASLIPHDDPTLLWINAGVSALKKYFDGTLSTPYKRITNAQKCIRTNDIDNVGHTSRHHTFFEMMGNFSIGDYFRHEVIPWAFELLTSEKYFGLDKDRLYVTYYPDDIDTRDTWIKAGISPDHMIPSESNFWEIGEGPCGPDTEINYDRGEEYDKEGRGLDLLKNDIDNDRYIELWNIVFSQYNSKAGKKREEYEQLPQKNIDTGAGLERFACILQGTETNFETDLFMPYIKKLEGLSNTKYEDNKLAYRVIADHMRSITFALADGAVFSNDGRGYVLKRLLRRASLYADTLGLSTGILASLVDDVSKNMNHFYPDLVKHAERTKKLVLQEEEKFKNTLRNGGRMLAQILEKSKDVVSGKDAFTLMDTYGFPLELTVEMSADAGKKVDVEEYERLLKQSKELSRASRGNKESFGSQNADLMAFDKESEFTYEEGMLKSKVIALFDKEGRRTDSLSDKGSICLEKTNFYAESGGQVSDKGTVTGDNFKASVYDVSKAPHGENLLHIDNVEGTIQEGDILLECIDLERRKRIEKNHSATHLLQKALQEIVSSEVSQKGAYYDDEMLRFDFLCDSKIEKEKLDEVERRVNELISEEIPVDVKIMNKEEAMKISSMHLFEEKYGDKVRVVTMGPSVEFCGGTHVERTSDIGAFVIASEQSISSGVRRITAYTGIRAYLYLKEKSNRLLDVASILSLNSDTGVESKVESLLSEIKNLKNQVESLSSSSMSTMYDDLVSKFDKLEDISVLVEKIPHLDHQKLDTVARRLVKEHDNAVVLLVSVSEGKSDLVLARGENLKGRVNAGKLMKEVAPVLMGSGGGKDDLCFGGCKDPSKIDEARKKIKELLSC